MIVLNKDYVIDFDTLNINLYKRMNSKGGNRKMFNNIPYAPIGHFGEFKHLLNHLVKNKIFCIGNSFDNLNDIVNAIEDFKIEIKKDLYCVLENKKIKYKGSP